MSLTKVTSLVLLFLAPAFGQQEEWQLAKDKAGIQIYTRKVDGFVIKEYKAEMILDFNIQKVSQAIQNVDSFKEWFVDIEEIEFKGDHPDGGIAVYMVINTPFPVQDRDLLMVMNELQSNEEVIRISTIADPDFVEIDDDYIRMPYSNGEWILEYIDEDKTRVINTNLSDPGGSIPKWVINMMLTSNPFNTFSNLRDYLAESN